MNLTSLFHFDRKDPKTVLLYRFHLVALSINLIAIPIDLYRLRTENAFIEGATAFALLLSLMHLRKYARLRASAYSFIFIISAALLSLIYINHFATMSVVFILLLPLTTLIFLSLKESFSLTLLYFGVLAALLYLEHLHNPANPLAHNFQALFNLAYTAVIIYIFGLLYHFTILRTFQELDASNHQKALLLREVHHRVKNNLNMIASIVGLHSNTLEGKEREEMQKTQSRIESIAIVHEMLYKHDNFARIDFKLYIKRLCDLLLRTYASDPKTIRVTIESDAENLPLEIMVQLGIMVNEFVTNSLKYAFDEKGGEITVSLAQTQEEYLLTYRDDGIGHPDPQTLLNQKSLGIKLINLTAKQLKGTLKISAPSGLQYQMRFRI